MNLIYRLFIFFIICYLQINFSFSQSEMYQERAKYDYELITHLYKEQKYDSIVNVFSKKADRYELHPEIYANFILAYLKLNDAANALAYSVKWEKISLRNKDTMRLISANRYKFNAFYVLGRKKEAINTCLHLNTIYRKKDSLKKTDNLLNLGLVYAENKQYKKAYEIYKNIKLANVKRKKLEYIYYNNFGLIYSNLGAFDLSIHFYKKALSLNYKNNESSRIVMNYANIGVSYFDKRDYKMAYKYLDSAENIKNIEKYNPVYKYVYQNFYALYKEQKNLDLAFIYLEKLKELNDTLVSRRVDNEIKELHSANKREVRLVKKVKIVGNDLEDAQKQTLVMVIIVLVLIIASGAIIFRQKIKHIKSVHQNIITEQRLLRSQMTPHFIFNSLSVVQGMILSNENRNATSYLAKFSKLMRLILENSRDKFVNLEDEMKAIEYYLDLQKLRFNKSLNWSIDYKNEFDEEILIPPMLIQPFVENSLKHGFRVMKENCEINIELEKKENYISCKIIDNGVGVDSSVREENRRSLSTSITAERLEFLSKDLKIEASLKIEDRAKFNEKGTIAALSIPYKTEI